MSSISRRNFMKGIAGMVVVGGLAACGGGGGAAAGGSDAAAPVVSGDVLEGELAKAEVRDRKSTRLNSSHPTTSRMPSSA